MFNYYAMSTLISEGTTHHHSKHLSKTSLLCNKKHKEILSLALENMSTTAYYFLLSQVNIITICNKLYITLVANF